MLAAAGDGLAVTAAGDAAGLMPGLGTTEAAAGGEATATGDAARPGDGDGAVAGGTVAGDTEATGWIAGLEVGGGAAAGALVAAGGCGPL